MFIPHVVCISVKALQRDTPACWFPRMGLGSFPIMVPCMHFLAYMQVHEVTPLKPCSADFVFLSFLSCQVLCLSTLSITPLEVCCKVSPSHIVPSVKPYLEGQPYHWQRYFCPTLQCGSQAAIDPQTRSHGHRNQNPVLDISCATNMQYQSYPPHTLSSHQQD